MGVMIQIGNVPEKVHSELKARAALAGMSLSDYILKELARSVEQPIPQELRPTLQEFLERLSTRRPVELTESIADAVRAEREGR